MVPVLVPHGFSCCRQSNSQIYIKAKFPSATNVNQDSCQTESDRQGFQVDVWWRVVTLVSDIILQSIPFCGLWFLLPGFLISIIIGGGVRTKMYKIMQENSCFCLIPGLVPLGSWKVRSSKMMTSQTFCLVPGLVPLGSCKRHWRRNVENRARKCRFGLGAVNKESLTDSRQTVHSRFCTHYV